VISDHFLGVAFDNFNDTWLYMGPEMMKLYRKVLVSIVEMLWVGQKQGACIVLMGPTENYKGFLEKEKGLGLGPWGFLSHIEYSKTPAYIPGKIVLTFC
jgi:hypothetical protein